MTYSFSFKKQFAVEFAKFPPDQQDKILDFAVIFKTNGLSDFSKYIGKISPSWSGIVSSDPVYAYAQDNHLWHYHIGIPDYTSVQPKYKTSDWVLHFQWINRGVHIALVDIYSHYKSDGTFHMPKADYLVDF